MKFTTKLRLLHCVAAFFDETVERGIIERDSEKTKVFHKKENEKQNETQM